MTSEECVGIGVEIGSDNLNFCCFNVDGDFFKDFQVLAPKPLMPGAVTIRICEFLEVDQCFKSLKYVGLAFPGIIDQNCRCIKECDLFKGWENVPIVDWLEVRLGLRVYLSSTNDCEVLANLFTPLSSVSAMASTVGYMAQKNF
tara:strand:+ start:4006 stop:4437 length:432 start_codon:yes stop_codon:yes gene_type:complete